MKGASYREPRGMPYVRREYIAGKPQSKIAKFSSGHARNDYDFKLELLVTENIKIRHNALEAARLAVNKRLAQAGEDTFFSKLKVYPHVLLRENKMIATAGADRLQSARQSVPRRPLPGPGTPRTAAGWRERFDRAGEHRGRA